MHYNVLFLCTGNSARSIMAKTILNYKGKPTFTATAFSAGSHPSGTIRPEARRELELARIPAKDLRSKSWEEFFQPGAATLHFVFTVCDNAAKEVCPGVAGAADDGALGRSRSGGGSRRRGVKRAFRDAFVMLDRSISLFLSLPLASLEQLATQKEIDETGRDEGPSASPHGGRVTMRGSSD